MPKLILRQEAIDDLTDIWDHTARTWSVNQADNYFGMIKSACNEIAQNSIIGRKYAIINIGLLGYKVGKHIVFYQFVANGEIEVVRILHERMDLKQRLTN